jgi:SnoaL-like domain
MNLQRHVARFNRGVRTGDFGPMVEAFSDDGELVFVGIPVGPFVGREAIREAYRAQPPDDEIVLLDGDGSYAWRRSRRSRRASCSSPSATARSRASSFATTGSPS